MCAKSNLIFVGCTLWQMSNNIKMILFNEKLRCHREPADIIEIEIEIAENQK